MSKMPYGDLFDAEENEYGSSDACKAELFVCVVGMKFEHRGKFSGTFGI